MLPRHLYAVAVTALAVVAVVAITSGSAATTTKPYTAFFDPGPVPGGSSVTIDLVLTNLSSPQAIGSANVTAPNGFTVTAAAIGGAGNVDNTFPTTLLKLRNLAIGPGTSQTISMTVTTPCASGPYTWGIRVKQSNDFSGPPGNDFSFQSDGSNLVTTVAGAGAPGSLAFTMQPGGGQVAPATLPTVEVTVYDTCGNVATDADEDVSLALDPPDDTGFGGGGSLGGTTEVKPTSGVATFSDLTVDASGQGYRLVASYPGLDDVTSDEFSVYDFFGPCTTPPCGVSDDTTVIELNTTSTDTVGLSLKAGSSATCEGLQVLGSAFTVVPPPGHAAFDIAVTLTINKRGLQGVGVANIVVCKNSGPGTDLEQLGKCPKKGTPREPCIVSQTSSNAGDAIIKLLINSTDPGGAGFS
jgi:hypothetical protein